MSIAQEITALVKAWPAWDAPAGERADWLLRKAAVFDRIAATDPHLCLSAAQLARDARVAAERVRRGVG